LILGRITGHAVSSRKDEGLLGTKLMLVEEVDPESGEGSGELLVVADHLGAGPGDVVLVTQGSAARFTAVTRDRPVDALVVGIVDTVRVEDMEVFTKERGFLPAKPAKAPARARSGRP
jgi:microcompartment protein CcmK/EutM